MAIELSLTASAPHEYVVADDVVEFAAPAVAELAADLWRMGGGAEIAFSRSAFEYVRDQIRRSWDVGDQRVTVTASETLRERVGLCYAKTHLLAALLRAQNIPAGKCYQRLANDRNRHEVHGLVALYLNDDWHRLDPRGNKPGVNVQFSLAEERLTWPARSELGERDYPEVFVHSHPTVVAALRGSGDILERCGGGLPEEL